MLPEQANVGNVQRTRRREEAQVPAAGVKCRNGFVYASGTNGGIGNECQRFLKHLEEKIYMLFTGREVRMGKNCARGLEYGPRPKAEGRTQDQGHSFFPYGPT